MTIPGRNYFFKGCILISLVSVIFILAASYSTLSLYPSLISKAIQRPPGLLENQFIYRYLTPASYIPFVTALSSTVYALISALLIYYFFEKTQAPEILFVALFSFSLAFEALRIMAPVQAAKELSGFSLIMAYRVLLFGRYFGIFSLFIASVCSSGLETQKQGTIILVVLVAALIIALGIPRASLSWDTTLSLVNGYQSLLTMVEAGTILITLLSFFVAAYSRGAREYIAIGIGSLLAFTGRSLLINADTWVTPFPGLVILSTGTWFIGRELRRVYLWL